jgi:hypothetical protein
VVRNDKLLEILVPDAQLDQVAQKPRVDDLEFACKHTTRVNIAV